MELVSIIVPVHNAAHYLEEGVASMMAQDYPNLEFIFVDDCSTDNSLAKLQELQAKYAQHKMIVAQNEHNMGSGPTRNHGFNLSQGKYVYFMDADDYAEPHLLSTMAQELERTQADFVMCAYDCHGESTKTYLINPVVLESKTPEAWQRNCFGFFYAPWTKLVRRSFLLENKIEFQDLRVAQDLVWTFSMIFAAKHIAFCNQVLYHYSVYIGSVSHSKSILKMGDSFRASAELFKHYHCFEQMKQQLSIFMTNWCVNNIAVLSPDLQQELLHIFDQTAQELGLVEPLSAYPFYYRYPCYKLLPKALGLCKLLREHWRNMFFHYHDLKELEQIRQSLAKDL